MDHGPDKLRHHRPTVERSYLDYTQIHPQGVNAGAFGICRGCPYFFLEKLFFGFFLADVVRYKLRDLEAYRDARLLSLIVEIIPDMIGKRYAYPSLPLLGLGHTIFHGSNSY